MPYIGFSPGMGTRDRFIYTATASQTTFSGADDNGKTLRYDSGDFVDVYLNGILLVPVTDYTATSLTSIVLTQAASADDTLEVLSLQAVTVADTVSKSQGGNFEAGVNIDGNVGIGTDAPADVLHVKGEGQITVEDTSSGNIGEIYTSNTALQLSVDPSGSIASSSIVMRVDGSERMRIDSDGNVGIGTTPHSNSKLHILDATSSVDDYTVHIEGYTPAVVWQDISGGPSTDFAVQVDGSAMAFQYGDASTETQLANEAMRINSSGNLLVGKTNDADSGTGVRVRGDGLVQATRNNADPLSVNRTGSAGDAVVVRYGGTAAGGFGLTGSHITYYTTTGYVGIGGTSASPHYYAYNLAFYPSADNTRDIGTSGNRFDDIRATNGTIQTSDERDKQQIASLTDAEITAAKAISKLFKTFKWNSAVTEKGDAARTHTGVIAQQVETAMTDAGLNAGDYAFFIDDTWWEVQTEVPAVEADEENGIEAQEAFTRTDNYYTADEAPEGATERNRKGIRYPELLSFIGAATEQRLASIESRLDALEAN